MRQVAILASLLLILVATEHLGARYEANQAFDAATLTTTGFILLAAYAFGELFRRMRLPALLGYLAAGLLFGPSLADVLLGTRAAAPIDSHALRQLGLVNMLAVGVIGTMGGGEIKIEDLRESFRKIATITVLVFVIVLPTIGAIVLGLAVFAPPLVPFLADVPLGGRIAASLLFGALAVGMSPSATLALLLEVRAQGRFTSLVLGIVVLADLVLVATFLLALALAKLLVSPEGVSAARLLEVLPHIGAEFGWAILLGLFVGLAFIAYLRLVGREVLLFSLGIVFVTSIVAARLHAETLLAFLVGGFVVQNFSRHGHELIEAFERIALPVFVIYFTTQAANLDLAAVPAYLPLTIVLVLARVGLFWLAISSAARMAGVDDQQRQLLRISFFSQGGVDLVLAAMIAKAIPAWGTEVQTVTVATILVYIVVGPPLLARALDRAGESAAAKERGAETLEARRSRHDVPRRQAVFAELRTGDASLDRRIAALRSLVLSLHENLVRGTIVERSRERARVVAGLAARITAVLDPEDLRDPEGALRSDALLLRLHDLHATVARAAEQWTEPHVVPIEPALLQDAFGRLAEAERFGSVYRVTREAGLFEPRGTWWQRIVRFARRLRRALLGPGMRTVPVGRLWRYHVALDVPVVLWSGLPSQESTAWTTLLRHYRVTTRTIEDLLAGRNPGSDPVAARSMSRGRLSVSHDSLERRTDSGAEPPPSPLVVLEEAHERAGDRERRLLAGLQAQDAAVERELDTALSDTWAAFVESIELAGTLEHPAWRYRVSARYDAAQAASADLRERLQRDVRIAAGARDTAAALAHAANVRAQTTGIVEDAIARIVADIEAAHPDLAEALAVCPALVAEADADVAARAGRVSTTLVRLSGLLERTSRRLDRADASDASVGALADELARVPAVLAPAPLSLSELADPGERRTPIRLQAWFDQTIAREITVALLDVRADTGRRLGAAAVAVQHARQVLEYHLATARAGGEGVDRSLAERLSSLLSRARADLDEASNAVAGVLRERGRSAVDGGVIPILEGRWDDVQRRQRRIDEGVVSRAALVEWLRDRVRRGASNLRTSVRRLEEEVTAVFVEHSTPGAVAAYRRLLFGPRTTLTDAYQRLFTSVPAESVGLVLPRPEAEVVTAGVERWLEGRGGPILVRGDRGVGKRTLMRQVFMGMGARIEAQWITLSPRLESEVDVARTLCDVLGWHPADGFDALTRQVGTRPRDSPQTVRRAVVVANVERLFRRTPAGLDRIQRFFELLAATSDEVLWVVLFAEPAARLLAPVLELEGRFPVCVSVPPMTAEQLERVLTMRHRLSGYELGFAHHAPTLHEWIRVPGVSWHTRRRMARAAYERLRLLGGGNVRQALRLWLAAAHLDPRDDRRVVIGPLDAMPDDLLDGLPLVSKVILAALLLHGSLTRRDLSTVALRDGHGLDAEITHLVHLGFVVIESAPRGENSGPTRAEDVLVSVRTRLEAPLTRELRACNLL